MMDLPRLQIVAARLINDRADSRHTVLDVSADFLAATADARHVPSAAASELQDLRREVEEVQPRFPSHRKTSILFDEAGLGKPGRERAGKLADRIIGLVRLLTAD